MLLFLNHNVCWNQIFNLSKFSTLRFVETVVAEGRSRKISRDKGGGDITNSRFPRKDVFTVRLNKEQPQSTYTAEARYIDRKL